MSAPRFETRGHPAEERRASPYWGEHVARYTFAVPRLMGASRVLDLACGSGFGLPLLATTSRLVVGVDIDDAAARTARTWGEGRAHVLLADAGTLPFSRGAFDAVTSFETLEHLERRPQFLAELARVLVPRGLCVLSTPNAHYTRPVNGVPTNPHHVHEYTPAELLDELRWWFDIEAFVGQTLDARFGVPPFWDAQQRLPKTVSAQTRLLLWRVINKLPAALRDGVSLALWRRPFFPLETDYRFDTSTVERAPVLVAVCRSRA